MVRALCRRKWRVQSAMTVVACSDDISDFTAPATASRCPYRRYPDWDRLSTLIKQPVNIRFINQLLSLESNFVQQLRNYMPTRKAGGTDATVSQQQFPEHCF